MLMGIIPEKEEMATEEVLETFDSEITYITPGTRIVGDISAEGQLVLDGRVEGNLNVDGGLVLHGSTTGAINAGAVLVDGTAVDSDINAYENVIINEDSVINGNISCQNITVKGIVNGNITATGTVFVMSRAMINGGISASNVGIEIGAKVSGKIDIK